jgi:hypothetical protein
MNGTVFFKHDPVYTARRLYGEGQGKESNPFPYDTADHKAFVAEMDRLEIEELKQEANQP